MPTADDRYARPRLYWLRIFTRVFDAHVLTVAALALLATWLSIRLGIRADLPSEIIAVAVVFPIVFSINAAYKRREDALRFLGRIRGSTHALWLAHRDWPEVGGAEHAERAAQLGRALDASICATISERRPDPVAIAAVTERIDEMSLSVKALRAAGVAASEISRANNYIASILADFENLRSVVEYRTPAALRAHSKVFLNLSPILYAPAYAQLAAEGGSALGYVVAATVAVVLVGLDNIQDGLEHPFDGRGGDDVLLGIDGLTPQEQAQPPAP